MLNLATKPEREPLARVRDYQDLGYYSHATVILSFV